ncbi:MAG: YHS domain protein [Flavobacteriales bacterium]|jgi:YHS domain-containing protein|nr:YHS domain protein [Flavobacteriales bacterium]
MRALPLLFLALLSCPPALRAQDLLPLFNVNEKGLWVEGYDPVAYFTRNKAVKGSPQVALAHKGATFLFSSTAHRDLFRRDPGRYLPQYGGWCAFAMGDSGKKVEVDPETFKVKEGKLYLFYNAFFNNTLTSWNQDEPRLRAKADRNWAAHDHKP